MNRLEHRALVRFYLDNINTDNDARYTDANINLHLKMAAQQAVTVFTSEGLGQHLMTTVNAASNALGTITVPLAEKIVNVYYFNQSNLRIRVKPGQRGAGGLSTPGVLSTNYQIDYIAKSTYPTDDVTEVTWAQSTYSNPLLDQYVCMLAAANLGVVSGELNNSLHTRMDQLKTDLLSTPLSPNISVMRYGQGPYQQAQNSYWHFKSPTEIAITLGGV